jgi:multiple antibiotic resistance protein
MEISPLKHVLLSFVPLFVAVDAIGVLPLYVSLTSDLEVHEKRRILSQSLVTASGLALAFILVGKGVFRLLDITMGDFMIAGGAILFCLAIIDLLHSEKDRRIPDQHMGVVPLGTPLIVGPAVLTTSLVSVSQYGMIPTVISVLINIALAGLLFSGATVIMRFLGQAGTKALSKVMALLLAAIAVMLIRKGFQQFIA